MVDFVNKIRSSSAYDWECMMLGIATFLLPFHTGHIALGILTLGNMGSKLSIFPVLIGLGLFLYQSIKKRKYYIPKICIAFFMCLFLWQTISFIHGLLIFADWQEISADQFKKLTFFIAYLSDKGIFIDAVAVGHLWWAAKLLLSHILDYCVTYGVVLWVISLFYRNREDAFHSFRYGILTSAVFCTIYSIIEILHLFGSYDAMAVLAHINPLIYDVGIAHGWWPPLFFGNRMRSVFAEPAYMALYLTVTIPFLYVQIYRARTKKWFWKILFSMNLFMMWGSNSKTAMGILLAEGLVVLVFLYLYRRQLSLRSICRPLIALIFLCVLGSGMNSIFQHRYAVDYDLISIESDDTVTLKITNKSDTIWEKRTGIALTSAWFTEDWQDECGRVDVPLNTTLLPRQSCEVTIKLPAPISKDDYPNVVMELAANNSFQDNVMLASQGAAKFILRWDEDHWQDEGESNVKENKMTALTSKTEGSNQQRYGLMYVELLIGRDHPIFGVGGQELKQAYFTSYIPDWLMKNAEVKLWIGHQQTEGFLKSGFPIIGDYTHQFASYGIVGLVLFLLPSFYGLYLLVSKRMNWLRYNSIEYMQIAILAISYFGLMVSFIGGNSTQLYIYWLLLGVLLGYYGTIGCSYKN